jgi:hypothetical protein
MRTISQRRNSAGRNTATVERDRALQVAQLDHVVAGGGPTSSGTGSSGGSSGGGGRPPKPN